jgi:histone H3/H4
MAKGSGKNHSYIRKMVPEGHSVSASFLEAMNKISDNIFDSLATTAGRLAVKQKRMTIKDDDVLMAIQIGFPGYLSLSAKRHVKESLETFASHA